MSRQGCESQWKGHFEVNGAMKTPAKDQRYVSYDIATASSLWPTVTLEQDRHPPARFIMLFWVTLHSQYSRCWEREAGFFSFVLVIFILMQNQLLWESPGLQWELYSVHMCRQFLRSVSTLYLILNLVNMYLPLITWIWVITLSSICFSVS